MQANRRVRLHDEYLHFLAMVCGLSIYLRKEIIESMMQAMMRWTFSLVVCGLICGLVWGPIWGFVAKAETVQTKSDTVNVGTAIHLTADAKAEGKPLIHFWSKVVGAGRANEEDHD